MFEGHRHPTNTCKDLRPSTDVVACPTNAAQPGTYGDRPPNPMNYKTLLKRGVASCFNVVSVRICDLSQQQCTHLLELSPMTSTRDLEVTSITYPDYTIVCVLLPLVCFQLPPKCLITQILRVPAGRRPHKYSVSQPIPHEDFYSIRPLSPLTGHLVSTIE